VNQQLLQISNRNIKAKMLFCRYRKTDDVNERLILTALVCKIFKILYRIKVFLPYSNKGNTFIASHALQSFVAKIKKPFHVRIIIK
jgi:hypothetical protein